MLLQLRCVLPTLLQILGVERNADEKEIKRAYRELARIYHPDKVRSYIRILPQSGRFLLITSCLQGMMIMLFYNFCGSDLGETWLAET